MKHAKPEDYYTASDPEKWESVDRLLARSPVTATEQNLLACLRATQSRRESFIEALVGTAIGFCVALVGQVFIMQYYGYATTLVHDLGITLFFTGLSIIRSYAVRRFFEARRKT